VPEPLPLGGEAEYRLHHRQGDQLGIAELRRHACRGRYGAGFGERFSRSPVFTNSAVARVSRSASTEPPDFDVGQRDAGA